MGRVSRTGEFSVVKYVCYTIMHSNCKWRCSNIYQNIFQTSKYSGAIFKSFKTSHEAQAFVNAHSQVGTKARKRPRDDDKMTAVASTSITKQITSTTTKQISSNNDAQLQITIHFDGGSRGNPGLAGSGAQVKIQDCSDNRTTTYLIREYVGTSETNNYAEYKGLIAGLHKAKTCIEQYKSMKQTTATTSTTNRPLFHLQFYGDSKLVIEQLKGTWRCKHPNLQILYQLCQKLIHEIKQMDANSTVKCDHVYREQNKIADGLANEAMDKRRSWTTSTESTVDNQSGGNDDDDERKQSAVPVSKKRKSGVSVWKAEKGWENVDDSDSDEVVSNKRMSDRAKQREKQAAAALKRRTQRPWEADKGKDDIDVDDSDSDKSYHC